MGVTSCAFLALLLACACSGPIAVLRPGAEQIPLLRERPRFGHESVGEVWCRYGDNARSLQLNADGCRAHVRNDAQELGADFVVLRVDEVGIRCRNCVLLRGQAYVRDGTR